MDELTVCRCPIPALAPSVTEAPCPLLPLLPEPLFGGGAERRLMMFEISGGPAEADEGGTATVDALYWCRLGGDGGDGMFIGASWSDG